jgi:hypothetical protein
MDILLFATRPTKAQKLRLDNAELCLRFQDTQGQQASPQGIALGFGRARPKALAPDAKRG